MNAEIKLLHGSSAWFHMAATLMCEAASQAKLSPDVNLALVECYTDGVELSEGLVQGLRFDIAGGQPSFRVGAVPGERADITVKVTAAASHALNILRSADPDYQNALAKFQRTGEMRVDGDLSQLGSWFAEVHDRIVDRTK
ncbi:hypothetical protein ACHAC9_13335 [Massilia sp. CMS3.1]|uniref:hypothetical protein n=1 Tax=Massilia sp. CMS3.1 TaxID=3373083 RepID=UPI003EE67F52